MKTSRSNDQLQLAARRQQLNALRTNRKATRYSAEDLEVLSQREASLLRMIATIEQRLAVAA